MIHINFSHNHSVNVAEAFSYLRCSQETVEILHFYFNCGMTPAAKNYHEIIITESAEDDNSALANLANAQVNPTIRQIINLFTVWRREHFGDRSTDKLLENLKKRKENLDAMGNKITIDDKTMTVAIVAPILKGVFALNNADEIVFVDSSSSCDQTNTCVPFVFCGSKIGGLPIGCILHASLMEDNYKIAFKLLKESLESNANKTFRPSVIMTDNSDAERNALQHVFPTARLLLCTFHVCQALWRWLWDKNHNIEKEDRKAIMQLFQNVLYSDTVDTASKMYEELLCSVKKNYPQAKNILRHCG